MIIVAIGSAVLGFAFGIYYSAKYVTPSVFLRIITEQGYKIENGRIVPKEEKKS